MEYLFLFDDFATYVDVLFLVQWLLRARYVNCYHVDYGVDGISSDKCEARS